MARTSLSRRGEAPYTDQPVESILEQLLQSPPPEKHASRSVQAGGASSVAQTDRLSSAEHKTPANAARTPCRQKRTDGCANIKLNGSLTGKFALAAASPIALASKTTKRRDSRSSEDTIVISSATSDTYSNASRDSLEMFAQPNEKPRAELGLQNLDNRTPHRTYWPKYSDDDCFVVAMSHASLSENKLLPDKSVQTVSKVPHSSTRAKVGSKALPLPIAIACPQGVNFKVMSGAPKGGRGASRDSTPTNWSSSASTTSDESGHEVSCPIHALNEKSLLHLPYWARHSTRACKGM